MALLLAVAVPVFVFHAEPANAVGARIDDKERRDDEAFALCLGLTGVGAIAMAEPAYAVGSRWDPNGAP